MWKIVELATYIITILLCIYQFAVTAPVVVTQIETIGVEVAQGVDVPSADDVDKIFQLGPWGIVLILSVKLVVDYFSKAKEQERCASKIKETELRLIELIKDIKTSVDKGTEENYHAVSEMQSRLEREMAEFRQAMLRLDQTLSHISVKTNEIYNWHNANDDSGGKVWYVKKSLYDSLDKLVDVQRAQNELLKGQQVILTQILKQP